MKHIKINPDVNLLEEFINTPSKCMALEAKKILAKRKELVTKLK